MRQYSDSNSGFTLIEIVVGMVVSAVALTLLYALIYPQVVHSTKPLAQVSAAELGQSIMEEVLARPYDELSPTGGVPPCNPCTAAAAFGADAGENARADFDDVDDFNTYCDAPAAVEDIAGAALSGFAAFRMQICVIYDGNYDGTPDSDERAKRVTVSVYAPAGGGALQPALHFTAYRGNF